MGPPPLGPPPAFPGDLSWIQATLIAGWIVGPFWGMNVCVFILCVHVLQMKGLKGSNLYLFIVASVQFGLSTGHLITLLVQLNRGFIGAAGTLDGPSLYLLKQYTPEHVAQEVLYITNSLIGDAILVWRLFIIWNRNIVLCSPFIVLCVATGVCGYVAMGNLAMLNDSGTVFASRVHNWLLAYWSLSIATQFGATLLIGYRFWRAIQWHSKGIKASRMSVLWILVESGAMYSVTTIILLGFSSSNSGAIPAAALGQISALAPTLIIVRAGLKTPGSLGSFVPAKGSISSPYRPGYSPAARHTGSHDMEPGTRPADEVVVHIRKATEYRLEDLSHREEASLDDDNKEPASKSHLYPP
ncbi:hypothetical protein BC834DRAFT_972945 [Gloeopeniophorella convolvens]|nr:hypothetical protein BC834DRAFT_972945 [Gloeopeniophorella convolvens]